MATDKTRLKKLLNYIEELIDIFSDAQNLSDDSGELRSENPRIWRRAIRQLRICRLWLEDDFRWTLRRKIFWLKLRSQRNVCKFTQIKMVDGTRKSKNPKVP